MRSREEMGIIGPDQADIDRANQSQFSPPSKLERIIGKFARPAGVATALGAATVPSVGITQEAETSDIQISQGADTVAAVFNVPEAAPAQVNSFNSFLSELPFSDKTKKDFLIPFLNSSVGDDLNPDILKSPNFILTQSFDNYDVQFFKASGNGRDVIINERIGEKLGKVYYQEVTIYPDPDWEVFESNHDIVAKYGEPDGIIHSLDGTGQMVYLSLGQAFEYRDVIMREAKDINLRTITKQIGFDKATATSVDEYKDGWGAKRYRVAAKGI